MLAAGVSATTGYQSSTQRHSRNWMRGNHASQTLDPRATGHLKLLRNPKLVERLGVCGNCLVNSADVAAEEAGL
jgi:hypothetical protein